MAEKTKKEVSSVIFTRKDGSTRTFEASLHGEDFVKVADEFGVSNALFIASREDK